jgi:hypothetical protein
MVSAFNKKTFQFVESINIEKVSTEDWIINPDVHVINDIPQKYWKFDNDILSEMTQLEKDTYESNELIRIKNEKINLLYLNYRNIELSNITPAGAIQLDEWCIKGNEKALAVRKWVTDLYNERDSKMDEVEKGGDPDPNPSSTTKPYSFREINNLGSWQ